MKSVFTVLALVFLTGATHAATTYSYTSASPDTVFYGDFTVATPLAANMSYQSISVLDWNASTDLWTGGNPNGWSAALGDPGGYMFMYAATDATGKISEWSFHAEGSYGGDFSIAGIEMSYVGNTTQELAGVVDESAGGVFPWCDYCGTDIEPGVWSSTAVPIPAAVWLFGSALAGLGWMRRKQTV